MNKNNRNKQLIDWQEESWNPVTGCTPFSKGCQNCYALPIAGHLKQNGVDSYKQGFRVQLHPERLREPFKINRPCRIFVDSMSDLFHEEVSLEFIQKVYNIICDCPQHLFLVVTKRAERLAEILPLLPNPGNLLTAVTVEHPEYKYRIKLLQGTKAINRVIFFEPLLADMGEIDLTDIKWAFVGGESGRKSRPIKKEWIYQLKTEKVQEACYYQKGNWI